MDGEDYLQSLAEAVGCRAIELLQRANVLLADLLHPDSGPEPDLPPLPSEATLAEYVEALLTSNGPLDYLTGRNISLPVLRQHDVGLNVGRRLTFPMRNDAGQVVAYKTRRPTPHGQMRNIGGPGRDWPLYPWPGKYGKRHGDPLIVCAGELDALCAQSYGFDACSVTLGAGCWRHPWTAAVFFRRVVICFDNGEQAQARRLCDGLLAAGVNARIASLQRLGLTDPKADLSDYLLGGGHPNELLKGAM